jgi:uncharacterized lipoprotein YmbA
VIRSPLLVAVLVVLFGCASSPKVNFYTLPAPPYPEARDADSSRLGILLGPVTLPEMVDRPQLVIRTGDNRVEILDTSRWAQSLKGETARVLAANLARDMGTLRVFLPGQGMTGEPDIRVAVDILRFESRPGIDATIEALWTLRRKEGTAPITGRSVVSEAVQGDGYDSLVAAHGRVLARIGHDIAEAIRKGNF